MSAQKETGNSVPTSRPDYTPEFGAKLKAVIDSLGTLVEASKIADVTSEQLARWRDGRAKPPFFAMARLTRAAGLPLDWLLGDDNKPAPSPFVGFDEAEGEKDFTLVPRVGVSASAGHGLVALAEEITERLAFKTDWLREMGLSPRFCGLLTARGDSMVPVIQDGALLLVDMRADQVIRSGCYYVIVLEGDVLVKLVNRRLDGTIELISLNPTYPKEVVDSQQLDKLTIPGRVVWTGQKL